MARVTIAALNFSTPNVFVEKSSNLDQVDGLIQALAGTSTGVRVRPWLAMRLVLLFISTTLVVAGHQHLHAQEVTNEEPPAASTQAATPDGANNLPSAPEPQQQASPDLSAIPRATVLPSKPESIAVLESDTQSKHGDLYLLTGDVVITYHDHVLHADTVTYNAATGEVTAEGHMRLTGGENDEYIEATHGTYNVRSGTGRFYDVRGSVGMTNSTSTGVRRPGYQSSNPFIFGGKVVVKTGPTNYEVYDGSVTSCLLPHPDWQLFSNHFSLTGQKATAANSTFKLLGIPLLFLPYVTHPTDSDERQSGLLIPVIGYSSASKDTGSKGLTVGEQGYLTLGRSADLTVGTLYYSLRGFSENGTFRYRGPADDFFTAHFSALQDRGFTTTAGLYVNQGGQDVTMGFRRQLTTNTRFVGDGEYLSSYVYREVFTENFNQAVSSDITSVLYLTRQNDGYSIDGRFDRYEGLKVVPVGTTPGEEVKVFHAPSIDFTAVDHPIAGTPLLWNVDASNALVKRIQPNFTSAMVERLDVRPELSLPLSFQGWHIMSSIASRETFYSRSRRAPYGNGATPVELDASVNRADVEGTVDIRLPVLERTFTVPTKLHWLLGDEVRHTIEPEVTYRNVSGINNFLSVLRFDDVDIASDTNELEYGVTQHLYFRPPPKKVTLPRPGCPVTPGQQTAEQKPMATVSTPTADESSPNAAEDVQSTIPAQQPSNDANGIPNASATAPDMPTRTHARHADPCASVAPAPTAQQEWFSWKLAQKNFFDQNFGGAIIDKRRNIFDTTLAFSGIAFLTEPRAISPLISRMRFRTSSHVDIEYDFDLDIDARKFNSQNIFLDLHEKRVFAGFSYARLNAPGRFYTEVVDSATNVATGLTSSATSNFSQVRLLGGYGTPSKPGISAAAGAGLDLNAGSGQDTSGVAQYVTLQGSYNWNCCGLTVEYRKYDLGAIRNEGSYRFNFTLANIGTAGNLRRNESLF